MVFCTEGYSNNFLNASDEEVDTLAHQGNAEAQYEAFKRLLQADENGENEGWAMYFCLNAALQNHSMAIAEINEYLGTGFLGSNPKIKPNLKDSVDVKKDIKVKDHESAGTLDEKLISKDWDIDRAIMIYDCGLKSKKADKKTMDFIFSKFLSAAEKGDDDGLIFAVDYYKNRKLSKQ
jgi:hypothetical protein